MIWRNEGQKHEINREKTKSTGLTATPVRQKRVGLAGLLIG